MIKGVDSFCWLEMNLLLMKLDQSNEMIGLSGLCNFVFERIAELLDGKGGGRKGRFQGKANKLQARPQVEALLRNKII